MAITNVLTLSFYSATVYSNRLRVELPDEIIEMNAGDIHRGTFEVEIQRQREFLDILEKDEKLPQLQANLEYLDDTLAQLIKPKRSSRDLRRWKYELSLTNHRLSPLCSTLILNCRGPAF